MSKIKGSKIYDFNNAFDFVPFDIFIKEQRLGFKLKCSDICSVCKSLDRLAAHIKSNNAT